MKRVYVNEQWCLGCHLCEYYCAFSNSGQEDMVKALKGVTIRPRLVIEEKDDISFAVSCRHCEEPLCAYGCISGALTFEDGMVRIDTDKCVGCYTCILSCPYGTIMPNGDGVMQKCELCTNSGREMPMCVEHCPNRAIVYEER